MFVFPSRTDTFGLVMLEAMASGVPVAAYPVTGPLDVVAQGVSGILDEDLGRAARAALKLDRAKVREDAFRFSWAKTAELFLHNISERLRLCRGGPHSAHRAPPGCPVGDVARPEDDLRAALAVTSTGGSPSASAAWARRYLHYRCARCIRFQGDARRRPGLARGNFLQATM